MAGFNSQEFQEHLDQLQDEKLKKDLRKTILTAEELKDMLSGKDVKGIDSK